MDLQVVHDVFERQSQRQALGPVDVQIQPRRVGPRAVDDPLQSGRAIGLVHDLIADVLQLLQTQVAAVLDHDLEAAGRSQSIDRRSAEDRDQCVADLLPAALPQLGSDGVRGESRSAPLVEVLQHHVQRAQIRGVGVLDQRLAGDPHRVRHARRLVRERLDAAP